MRKFRLGMLIGFGAGYVLGTRAGRQRYEDIRSTWHKVMKSEPAQQLQDKAQEAASQVGEQIERATSDTASQAAGMPHEDSTVRSY